jgi:hypothetical protein
MCTPTEQARLRAAGRLTLAFTAMKRPPRDFSPRSRRGPSHPNCPSCGHPIETAAQQPGHRQSACLVSPRSHGLGRMPRPALTGPQPPARPPSPGRPPGHPIPAGPGPLAAGATTAGTRVRHRGLARAGQSQRCGPPSALRVRVPVARMAHPLKAQTCPGGSNVISIVISLGTILPGLARWYPQLGAGRDRSCPRIPGQGRRGYSRRASARKTSSATSVSA